jgi:tetratricopeptide (TPR) repeat protein
VFRTIQQIDAQLFRDLPPESQELIAYIALGQERLLVSELAAATSRDAADVFAISDRSEHFLRQSESGFQFQHSHQLEVVLSILSEQPLRRTYLQRRLARALNKKRSPLRSFLLLDSLGDPQSLHFAAGAAFEAVVRGDNRSLLQVSRRRLSAKGGLSDNERVAVLLARAHAERQSALDGEASASLKEAELLAERVGDAALIRDVRYLSIYEEVSKSLRREDLENLVALVDSIDPEAEPATRARYSVDLSALYIRLDDFAASSVRAREALALFTAIDDGYGVAVAKKNLVGALFKEGGHAAEVEELTNDVEANQTKTGSIRDRAWLCNLRTRECRLSGKLDEAFAYASEAIEIATELGDARLKALNQLNLGNVLKDQEEFASAIEQYLRACKGGFEVGDQLCQRDYLDS